MDNILELVCVRCGQSHPPAPDIFTCPACHREVDYPGLLEVVIDPGVVREALPRAVARPLSHGIWHWNELMPKIDAWHQVSLGEGNTPLIPADRLAGVAGFPGRVLVKADFMSPTGSYKDRLAAVVVSVARAAGAKVLALVSSGNMGAAVAAYAAASGLRTCVIVPPPADPAKLAQILLYGGQVVRVRGSGGDRLGLLERAVAEFGWYNANSPCNPFGPEGSKTTAYELWLGLGRTVPDWVVVPVGFGCNLVGIWRGFRELREAGLIDRLPRLVGIQPQGSPSFVRAFQEGRDEAAPDQQDTLAWGISQKVTLHSRLGLRALRDTGGSAEAVTDEAILQAELELGRTEGLFLEPSSAAAVAGFFRLVGRGMLAKNDTVVIVATGSGLKQLEVVRELVPPIPEPVDPDVAALHSLVR